MNSDDPNNCGCACHEKPPLSHDSLCCPMPNVPVESKEDPTPWCKSTVCNHNHSPKKFNFDDLDSFFAECEKVGEILRKRDCDKCCPCDNSCPCKFVDQV